MRRYTVSLLTASTAAALIWAASGTAALGCPVGTAGCTPFAVEGQFEGKDGESNLSAIDCAPQAGSGMRACLLVDDELKKVQFATLGADRLVAGQTVKIFDDSYPDVLGTAPAGAGRTCPGGEDGGEMDGEAIAYAEPYFYVAGSHGCSRSMGEYRPETFVLARLKTLQDGSVSVERTYRLSDVLGQAAAVKAQFAQPLDPSGLNLEGIEVADGALLIGLRAPASENAFIVKASIEALFAPGAEPLVTAEDAEPIELGKGMGVRDMEILPDGRLLVLGGPAGEDDGPYRLTAFKRGGEAVADKPRFEKVGQSLDLPAGNGSPEAIEWLGNSGSAGNVLVLSDRAPNGSPYTVTLP